MDIKERVIDIVQSNMTCGTPVNTDGNQNFIQDLGFDSIKLMGLFYSVEEEFSIEIFDNPNNFKFFSIETLNDLIELIQEEGAA